MTKDLDEDTQYKLRKSIELLKFIGTLDDQEIIKSTIEAVIELLEEEVNQR